MAGSSRRTAARRILPRKPELNQGNVRLRDPERNASTIDDTVLWVRSYGAQRTPYPPSGDVHAGCDWWKRSSSCRSVSSARDASVLLDPRGE